MSDQPKTQYVGIRFRGKGIIYSYTNDGPEVFVGDRVKVDGRDGWTIQTVETVDYVPPNGNFKLKAIMGRVEDVPAPHPDSLAETKRREGKVPSPGDENILDLRGPPPAMTPLEKAEADRCFTGGVSNIRNGKCTTCGKAPGECDCLPF